MTRARLPAGRRWALFLLLALSLLACTGQEKENFHARLDRALADSWSFYKIHYIQPDGRVQRPDSDHDSVSEGPGLCPSARRLER